jgi:zinc D-Ala-D-Ala dipeptidase
MHAGTVPAPDRNDTTMIRHTTITVAAWALLGGAAATSAQDAPRGVFVDAADVVPGLIVDMRYFGSNNFIGRRVAGYDAPICILTAEAATALAGVQAALEPFGLGLKVFDCYRPQRVGWPAVSGS